METSPAAGGAMYHFLACTVSQFMTRSVKAVTRQTAMRELEALFEKHDFNAFPVVENGRCLGIVSKFDFLRAFAFTSSQIVPHYDELMRRPVADVMTEAVVHVDPTSPLTRVLQLMVSLKTRSFPVLNAEHQLEGMISREDVMRALKETTQERPTILFRRAAKGEGTKTGLTASWAEARRSRPPQYKPKLGRLGLHSTISFCDLHPAS